MRAALQRFTGEFVGTFMLVFVGCAAVVLNQWLADGENGLLVAAVAHGAVLVVAVNAFIGVSGAQFNPAVSVALVVAGKQSPAVAFSNIITQLVAAGAATGAIVAILGRSIASNPDLGTNLGATVGVLTLGTEGLPASPVGVIVVEAILTFMLMTTILWAIADEEARQRFGGQAGMIVGLTVVACILAGAPLTGASLNPARTFGPALYGHWDMHWAYWAGPVLGASAASVLYRAVRTVGDRSRLESN